MNNSIDFEIIPQNARTIIFEQFNPDRPNLCLMLNGCDDNEMREKSEREFCVKSFEEFKEKFSPTVYEIFRQGEDNRPYPEYSLEKIDGAHPIELCKHEFYQAVHDIAVKKFNSNVDNKNIDYEPLYQALDPEKIYQKAIRRRDEINQFYAHALEEQDKGNPDGVKKWLMKADETFDAVQKEYAGNALRILPLAVHDTEIILKGQGIDTSKALPDDAPVKALPCKVVWKNGLPECIPLDVAAPKVKSLETRREKILQLTDKDWEYTVDDMIKKQTSVDKELFLSVYSEKRNSALAQLTPEQLKERKDIYSSMYVTAQQSFCDAVGALVQKVISVEQFFLHAGNENGIVESGVIIANCTLQDALDHEETVKKFLKAVDRDDKKKIWFAILPPAIDKNGNWKEELVTSNAPTGEDLFAGRRRNSTSEIKDEIKEPTGTVKIADINRITKLLAENHILSFFNFNACEETGFSKFEAKAMYEKYQEESLGVERKDSVSLAYPNFTIIPKNKRQVEMVNHKNLYTPSIYVNAAYIAAGLIVATQTREIQKKKFGKRVADNKPFVRFNLEQDNYNMLFPVKSNPETGTSVDPDAILLRGKEGNAFCFADDTTVKHPFVLTARTLDKKPIYQFLTSKYLVQLFNRMHSTKFPTVEDARNFASNMDKIKHNEESSKIVNTIFQAGEEFDFNEETTNFTFRFKGMNEPISIGVEIVKEDDET